MCGVVVESVVRTYAPTQRCLSYKRLAYFLAMAPTHSQAIKNLPKGIELPMHLARNAPRGLETHDTTTASGGNPASENGTVSTSSSTFEDGIVVPRSRTPAGSPRTSSPVTGSVLAADNQLSTQTLAFRSARAVYHPANGRGNITRSTSQAQALVPVKKVDAGHITKKAPAQKETKKMRPIKSTDESREELANAETPSIKEQQFRTLMNAQMLYKAALPSLAHEDLLHLKEWQQNSDTYSGHLSTDNYTLAGALKLHDLQTKRGSRLEKKVWALEDELEENERELADADWRASSAEYFHKQNVLSFHIMKKRLEDVTTQNLQLQGQIGAQQHQLVAQAEQYMCELAEMGQKLELAMAEKWIKDVGEDDKMDVDGAQGNSAEGLSSWNRLYPTPLWEGIAR
ncbi:hypothetical protein PMIN06_010735 [Paraphaeosphaeria minitans]